MAGSGLEQVMKAAFGGVMKMLTGKNFTQNNRAIRIVDSEPSENESGPYICGQ